MRLGIDAEFQHLALASPRRPRRERAAVGHFDDNFVIVWMDVLLHRYGFAPDRVGGIAAAEWQRNVPGLRPRRQIRFGIED